SREPVGGCGSESVMGCLSLVRCAQVLGAVLGLVSAGFGAGEPRARAHVPGPQAGVRLRRCCWSWARTGRAVRGSARGDGSRASRATARDRGVAGDAPVLALADLDE